MSHTNTSVAPAKRSNGTMRKRSWSRRCSENLGTRGAISPSAVPAGDQHRAVEQQRHRVLVTASDHCRPFDDDVPSGKIQEGPATPIATGELAAGDEYCPIRKAQGHRVREIICRQEPNLTEGLRGWIIDLDRIVRKSVEIP